MYTLHAEIKCDLDYIFIFVDNYIDENKEEPTDLDHEADYLCRDFIDEYIIADGVDNIKIDDKELAELKTCIKLLVYLKRHNPDFYEKLDPTELTPEWQPTECKNSAGVPTESFR